MIVIRRIFAILLLTSLFVLGLGAASAMAVPVHQHKVVTPSGQEALVALGFCQNPDNFAEGRRAHHALHLFHEHVHLGTPPVGLAFFC